MSIKRQDATGRYRDFDPNTQQFLDEDEYPLGSGLGQSDHQLTHTNKGNIYDRDYVRPDVVDETGLAVVNEDEEKVKEFIKNAISVDSLVATFNDNSHETLLKLLALQDNKAPLKKGGIGIAYRTDALIMHCKMEFSAEENVVFDAILGTISSYPDDKTYRIEPGAFVKFSKYKSENTLYDTFKSGTEKLMNRHLVFENLGPNGEDDIVVPWFDILRYHKKDRNNGVAYIEFKPSDFFKDLALCSGLVHGAFGSLEVTTQLQGKYTIALYWFLESKKRYKEYPTATPGMFEIPLEEFRHQFSIPQSYVYSMIENRVLKPAYNSINSINECDFNFEYEPVREGKKVLGYRFQIQEKNFIDSTATEILEIEDKGEKNVLVEQVSTILSMSGVQFGESEIKSIANCMSRNNKDVMALMTVLPVFKSRIENANLDAIEDKTAYICSLIQGDTNPKPTGKGKTKKNNNSFNNFQQRDYDMDELEKKLIGH